MTLPNISKYKVINYLALLTTLLISLVIIISTIWIKSASTDSFAQKDKELKELQEEVKNARANANKDLETASVYAQSLTEEITKRNKDIDQLDESITKANQLITLREAEKKSAEEEVKALEEDIILLLKDLQKNQNTSAIGEILTSNNLADALSNVGSLSNLGDQAESLRQDFNSKVEELDQVIELLEQDKEDLESLKSAKQSEVQALEQLKIDTQNDQARYARLVDQFNDRQKELDALLKENKAAWDQEIIRQRKEQEENNNNNSGGGGNVTVPRGECWFEDGRKLTIPNGYFARAASGSISRVFANCSHDGVDIANKIGTPIYSIAPGIVAKVGAVGSYNAGFGNYLLIKHTLPSGQRIYSLYAHLSSAPLVRSGQAVGRGQKIGTMGSTGFSTGPHLHLMIYSDTYESRGLGCRYGSAKCFNPLKIGVPVY